MNIFFIYFLGVTVCGLLHLSLYETKFFNNHINKVINQALSELKNETKDPIYDTINSDLTKALDILVTSLFSWLGVLYLLILVLEIYCQNKK